MAPAARSRVAAARSLRAACILNLLTVLPILTAILWISPSFAADPPAVPAVSHATAAPTASRSEVRPAWSELTPAQRDVLGPLESQWPQFDSNHKTKWLAVSAKYPSMTPEQQQRLKQNIVDWAKLTPEQHRLARESYAKAKKLNAEQKTEQWQRYQQLPEEQKQKLAAAAAAKKRVANVPAVQSKAKTVEPLRQAKKPATQTVAMPGAPRAPASALSPTPTPIANQQPATPAAPINK